MVSVLLGSTIILDFDEAGSSLYPSQVTVVRLIIATYLFSFGSYLFLKFTDRFTRFLTYLQIIWDLIFVTLLLLITGGITSPYSFFYFLSIINASVLLARREAYYTASLCGILYGAILDFQYFGRLIDMGLSPVPAQQLGAKFVFSTIFLNFGAFYLTAFLTGYLAERAQRSESALKKKVIDFEELERLNSSIVSNLGSGLLTITNEGKVRVFNRYVQQLTGVSLEDAYDRPLCEIITPFEKYGDGVLTPLTGEVEYFSDQGTKLIIGFKSVPLTDMQGNRQGAIINLLDLTQIKRMEAELKKADRLAAIGELSARIAHEIRNPLAAISGSVQLIAQGAAISDGDKRLLTIVERESDRLNLLISDFLAYARPAAPEKTTVVLHNFIKEMQSLVSADSRFERVALRNDCPPGIAIAIDRDQFKQVFWNLLVNAADAMPDGGTVTFTAIDDAVNGENLGNDFVKVVVEDNGIGMDERVMGSVFEPFFTTKNGGTGLGLATVYRIIQSHGGSLHIESNLGSGSRFTILIPK
ncbi:PAS domain-containing sensor histidine kinase [Geobacter sp. AOG1]|nr:PAS domain-containing sensor histidine kinase [Geobacter sp. AOG1]